MPFGPASCRIFTNLLSFSTQPFHQGVFLKSFLLVLLDLAGKWKDVLMVFVCNPSNSQFDQLVSVVKSPHLYWLKIRVSNAN